ncbi:MAG TPA: hypothetical protein ENJ61_00275 [Aquifex aeolicus]|uniref:Conjugal transfer protein TraK n=1 Tax=Aquifex aeolicus TaxID=63363 RepID=A0A7C5QDF3_AQUAO|nr:hypothetical protein [Aquifex aeolicus]
MRRILPVLGLVSLVLGKDFQVVEGSGYHYVEISLTDVNRIVCSSEITGVVYSKEKSIEIKRKGRNAWVKILPTKKGEKIEYPSYPREVYIECGGLVFSLILLPRKIPAATVVLKVPHEDDARAREFEKKAGSYEKLILSLIRHAYREVPPPGYRVKKENRKVREFKELDLYLLKSYEGSRYVIEEYLITAKEDVHLTEGSFVPYIRFPAALSIVKPRLKAGESTRLLVVRLREE